ncbi:MAG: hypothetical protein NTZ49_00860 [Candidatus Parcubacteria bacterium]|nr:hypothetical protein [Candidatus Parcubacteria bacterium]
MDYKVHTERSFNRIYRNDPDFLKENWDQLYPLIWELHFWFDYFFGDKGYETGYTLFYHREKRHHVEGITEAIKVFTKKYGEKFRQIIREESEAHVFDDFGEIPSQAECSRHYLREKRGW